MSQVNTTLLLPTQEILNTREAIKQCGAGVATDE